MPSVGENRSDIVCRRIGSGSCDNTDADESVMEAPKPTMVW